MERWKRRKEDKWKGGKGERKKRRKEDKWKGGKGERKKRRNRLDITINTQAIICFIFSFIFSNAADCKSTETGEVQTYLSTNVHKY